MKDIVSAKLDNAIRVIDCERNNINPCSELDVKDVDESYANIFNCLKLLKSEGHVNWFDYFFDGEVELDCKEGV